MELEDLIKKHLVIGNPVVVTLRYNPGIEEEGVVDDINEDEVRLRGRILNEFEHYSNISADPIYRTSTFNIKDIASIRTP